MKHLFTIAISLLAFITTASAQTEKISLRIPNFARPLVEKWANDYKNSNHNVDFHFKTGKSNPI